METTQQTKARTPVMHHVTDHVTTTVMHHVSGTYRGPYPYPSTSTQKNDGSLQVNRYGP